MTMAGSDPRFLSTSTRRLLLLPAALLALVACLPWGLEFLERHWTSRVLAHVREALSSAVTVLLGIWILTLIHREQRVSRDHLEEFERLSSPIPCPGSATGAPSSATSSRC